MFESKKIVKRSENFAQWYTSVINNAQLVVYGAIKGTMIFQPNGWSIWESIHALVDQSFAACGVKNVALPLLIPMEEFAKEKKHIDGFAPECFLVNQIGDKMLESPYVIRPTSEILFCKYFAQILNTYKQLPLKFNQWCNILRAEKNTRPFLRNSEFHWQELHAVFADEITATNFTKDILSVYVNIIENELCIPTIKGEKTEGERFSGAERTYSVETLMQDGQMLQSGTSHYLGTNFSKIYDIKFQNSDNQYSHVHQMSAGISTRLIGGIIMVHGDDNGLVLPPAIAPIQIKINVMGAKKEPKLLEIAADVMKQLCQYRVQLDDGEEGLGSKLSNGEINGVPIQLIIGRETLEREIITIIRRDELIKKEISILAIDKTIEDNLLVLKTNIFARAKNQLNSSIIDVSSLEELKTVLGQNKVARVHWAGTIEDEQKVKELTGATPRVIIEQKKGTCFFTNKPSQNIVIFGRAY